jgi:hypothetical protein
MKKILFSSKNSGKISEEEREMLIKQNTEDFNNSLKNV